MPSDRHLTISGWITWGILVLFAVVLVLLALPAIQQSKEAARRTESKYNLRQIGLALRNYHDSYRMFPPGATVDDAGVALHGWATWLAPFLSAVPASGLPQMNRPWDDRTNYHYAMQDHPWFLISSIEPTRTEEGLGLTHYAGSDCIFYRNSGVGLLDLVEGQSHAFLVGEAFGNYVPREYPFNWRDLTPGLRKTSGGFGYPPWPYTRLLLADGSVQAFSDETDAAILAGLATVNASDDWADRRRKPPHPERFPPLSPDDGDPSELR